MAEQEPTRTWAYPLDVTAMNPFQGMTSMLMAVNPYFNPGTWIFQTGLPEVPKQVVSFIVYFVEVTASTFVLGGDAGVLASIRLRRRAVAGVPAVSAVQLRLRAAGLARDQSHLRPHADAQQPDAGGVHPNIGAETRQRPAPDAGSRATGCLRAAIVLLVLLIVLAAPFYNGGMLVGTFLLTGVIFLSSQSVSQMLWRLAAGVYVLACCAALGFSGFFAGAQAYSARFSGFDRPLLQFHWPVEFSPDLIASARQGLCAWGVVCDRLAQWPLALTGSYWLQVSIIVGAIAVAIRMRPPLARVGALFAVLWIVLLMIWIGANLGIIAAFSLSPIYFF